MNCRITLYNSFYDEDQPQDMEAQLPEHVLLSTQADGFKTKKPLGKYYGDERERKLPEILNAWGFDPQNYDVVIFELSDDDPNNPSPSIIGSTVYYDGSWLIGTEEFLDLGAVGWRLFAEAFQLI